MSAKGDGAYTTAHYGRIILALATRGFVARSEDVRGWTREWVEEFRDEVEGLRDHLT